MPFLSPKKSGIHRLACRALYRALLQQARRVTATPLRSLKHGIGVKSSVFRDDTLPTLSRGRPASDDALVIFRAIARQFRDCAGLQRHHQIIDALSQGYKALNLLRPLPDPLERTVLSKLVDELAALYPERPSQTTSDKALSASPNGDHPGLTPSGKQNDGPRVWRHPSTSPDHAHILSRPLPRNALTGKRQVPHLFVSCGVPFLRVKKPQPAYLSRIIRDKREKQQRRVDLAMELSAWWSPLAHAEDAWDIEVRRRCKKEGTRALKTFKQYLHGEEAGREARPMYRDFVDAAFTSLNERWTVEKARERWWGRKLWSILQEERRLKFEEEDVLVPLLGPNPERKQIMAKQRRERKQKTKERLEREKQARDAKAREKLKAKDHRKVADVAAASQTSGDSGQDLRTQKRFVVQIER